MSCWCRWYRVESPPWWQPAAADSHGNHAAHEPVDPLYIVNTLVQVNVGKCQGVYACCSTGYISPTSFTVLDHAIATGDVSVSLSVTFHCFVQTNKDMIVQFSVRLSFVFLEMQSLFGYSQGTTG